MTRRRRREEAAKKKLVKGSNKMNEVVPGVWVGNRSAAGDRHALNAAHIGVVVSIGGGPAQQKDLAFIKYGIKDNQEDARIPSLMLDAATRVSAIRGQNDGTGRSGVLFHCMAGMSRSPSFAAAYCMIALHMPKAQALIAVRIARPIIRIQRPFLDALDTLEATNVAAGIPRSAATPDPNERTEQGPPRRGVFPSQDLRRESNDEMSATSILRQDSAQVSDDKLGTPAAKYAADTENAGPKS